MDILCQAAPDTARAVQRNSRTDVSINLPGDRIGQQPRSDVFDAYIRMMPDPQEAFSEEPEERRPPRFQWWDPKQSLWRDAETDKDVRLKAESRKEERTNNAVEALHEFLDEELTRAEREQIAAVWRGHGPSEDYLQRIKAVLRMPSEWHSLLLTDEPNNDTGT